jgi:pyruvate ferredoxin oxidoreductase gamma subunit
MEMLEIRWHGRGGQGVVTAAKFLTELALAEDRYFQAFPEYGPERMGAPIQAFTRIADRPINIRTSIRNPDVVAVLDPTLIGTVNVTDGLKENGYVIVNSPDHPETIRKALGLEGKPVRVFSVNATQISLDTIGRPIPNTPMIGALNRALNLAPLDQVIAFLKKSFGKKFSDDIVEANIQAVTRAYNEVREG